MEVFNKLKCYEVNGEEQTGSCYPVLEINSHWPYSDRIILVTPKGEKLTVLASDLIKAIRNAQNHN